MTVTASLVSPPARVDIDTYAANALAEDYHQVNPAAHEAALLGVGPPPRLFTGGTADLPLFTASGIDPAELMRLPAAARHWAAAQPDPAIVGAFIAEHAGDPHARADHPGLTAAVRRIRDWAAGHDDHPQGARQPASPELARR